MSPIERDAHLADYAALQANEEGCKKKTNCSPAAHPGGLRTLQKENTTVGRDTTYMAVSSPGATRNRPNRTNTRTEPGPAVPYGKPDRPDRKNK